MVFSISLLELLFSLLELLEELLLLKELLLLLEDCFDELEESFKLTFFPDLSELEGRVVDSELDGTRKRQADRRNSAATRENKLNSVLFFIVLNLSLLCSILLELL